MNIVIPIAHCNIDIKSWGFIIQSLNTEERKTIKYTGWEWGEERWDKRVVR